MRSLVACLSSRGSSWRTLSTGRPWRVANARTGGGGSGGGGRGSKGVLFGIIGTNVAVFAAWNTDEIDLSHRAWMFENFTMSSRGVLVEHKYSTIISHFFSHKDPMHLFTNMLSLWFFGSEACVLLGAQRFLMLYMGGGLVSAGATIFLVPVVRAAMQPSSPFRKQHSIFRLPRPDSNRNLGASGAVNAVVAWGILSSPWRSIFLFPIPFPIPACVIGVGFLASETFSLLHRPHSHVGHGAHLGGAAYGSLLYFMFRR